MKFETIKSFVLTMLVGLSLLLTFSLWNYQQNYQFFSKNEYVDQQNLGGTKVTKKDIIEPNSIIFHNNGTFYGFADPSDRQALYHDMQTWILYDLQIRNGNAKPSNEQQLEITFPEPLSMQLAASLFSFNEDVNLPNWRFKRIYITFNRDAATLNMVFLSLDGQKRAVAAINNSERYELLWSYLTTLDKLKEFKFVDSAGSSFYIPKFQVNMVSKRLTITPIDPWDLVDVLFAKPDVVSRNQISKYKVYFTDGLRGMRVFQEPKSMKYQNPYPTPPERKSPIELIELSMKNINGHKGWTGQYNLKRIDTTNNTIHYQMYYNSYPVYNSFSWSTISQEWRVMELSQYNRPLFKLGDVFSKNSVKLRSGNEVIRFLKNSRTYDLSNVNNIRVGYHMSYQGKKAMKLEPAWYINYKGYWQEIIFEETSQNKGES